LVLKLESKLHSRQIGVESAHNERFLTGGGSTRDPCLVGIVEMNPGGSSLARSDTGTSGLDHILGGGFPPHALYLLQGDPGVGKTTLAMQFLLAGSRRSESCLYVTFSETREELFAVAHWHGWTLDDISFLELSNFAQQLTAEAENTLFDPADIELHDVTKIVFAEIERIKPRLAVLESSSF
jgi:circadian clock protein KaiC